MATVYSAPEPAPAIEGIAQYEQYEADCEAYIERMQKWARDNRRYRGQSVDSDALVGEILRVGYADGYAQYVVIGTKPVQLMHLAVFDAWDIPTWQARGLRLTDVRRMIASDKAYLR